MSGASLRWLEAAGKAERQAEREARARAKAARARTPDPTELPHLVRVPRWRWPAAHVALTTAGVPFLAEASDDARTIVVLTSGNGRATLQRFAKPERNP